MNSLRKKGVSILSMRDLTEWPSWHCVFDWEDEIAAELDLEINKLSGVSKMNHLLFNSKTLRFTSPLLKKMLRGSGRRIGITFLMSVVGLRFTINARSEIIPIFIDTPTSSVDILKNWAEHFHTTMLVHLKHTTFCVENTIMLGKFLFQFQRAGNCLISQSKH